MYLDLKDSFWWTGMKKDIAEYVMSKGKAKGFHEDEHDTLWFEDRVYVPNDPEIRKLIL